MVFSIKTPKILLGKVEIIFQGTPFKVGNAYSTRWLSEAEATLPVSGSPMQEPQTKA